MLPVWGVLLGWHLSADLLGCPVAALLFALVAGLLALLGTETAFYRRHAFLSHYLVPEGRLFRVLGRRILILIRQGIKSLVLAFFLLIGALSFDWPQWTLLLIDILLLTALIGAFSSLFAGEVREPYRLPLARQWASRVNALLLWIAWGLLVFFSPQQNYSDLSWEQVIAHGAHESQVGCDALTLLANLSSTGEALALWFAQTQFRGIANPDHMLAAWGAFVAVFGASFLIVWAYSRALTGTLARPWRFWSEAEGSE